MTKPTTVIEYIEAAPEEARDKLHEIRALLKKVAPDATEKMKWGNPVLEQGRILFSYAAYQSHLNFMPTRSSLDPFRAELAGYQTGRDTIQLPYDQPLPRDLIERIAEYRVREVAEEDALWMHRD